MPQRRHQLVAFGPDGGRLGPGQQRSPARGQCGPEVTVHALESISQFEYWSHTHLTVDLVKGRGSGFSLEAPEGFRFMIRSRLFTEEELAELAAVGR